jgi:hypothetical protein
MTDTPSQSIRLYGTEEIPTAPRILTAGPLTAELDAGNLRHIKVGGVEVMRAVSYIVRDKDWGTYNPAIENLVVDEAPGRFTVSYDATAGDDRQKFRYSAKIEGTPSGVAFRASGEAVTDFLTNRTGFVVLHPIEGVAGRPVEIEHVDGRIVQGRFPELIDPVQPMMDLRALTHEAAPGLRVTCRMEGDTFEMEDQRNWADASYKTYVRPLALPWPYTLPAGTKLDQSVTLSLTGLAPASASAGDTISVRIGEAVGPAPALGLGLDPEEISPTLSQAAALASVGARHLVCHYDPRRAHDRNTLRQMVVVAGALGATPWLEAVVTTVDDFEHEITELGEAVAAIGSPFETVLLSPAPDLKCTLPGSVWPPAPPAAEMFRAAREAFPGVRLGGGMFSFFTELNRKRPPVEELDLVGFTTVAMVHAGDDKSVMEGLEALPAIAASARAIAGKKPLAVGPSAIGLRMNPYGAAPMENPKNIRQAMNRNDPRQRGLLGAAWTVGYYAHFARAGFEAVAFGGTTGPFGLVHTPQKWPTPGYPANGGVYPMFHAARGLASLAGKTMRALDISQPSALQGVCVDGPDGRELWLANLTPDVQRVALPGPAKDVVVLDAESFEEAARNADFVTRSSDAGGASEVTLGAFAIARIRLA